MLTLDRVTRAKNLAVKWKGIVRGEEFAKRATIALAGHQSASRPLAQNY
jgi:hypothetical protein